MIAPILDTQQVADLLKCSVKTVQKRAGMGDLPGEKFGDDWVFPSEALLARVNQIAVEQAAVRRKGPAPRAVILKVAAKSSRPSLAGL